MFKKIIIITLIFVFNHGANESKLKKGFRDLFGMGVFERLLHYRMERAKKLLLETSMREKEIAALTGYRHLTSFIHIFKRRYGLSPREYRKKLSGEK